MNNNTSVPVEHQPAKSSPINKIAAAALALSVALGGGNLYLLSKTNHLEDQMSAMRSSMNNELSAIQQDIAARSAKYNSNYSGLRQQIDDSNSRSSQAALKAAAAAKRYSDELAKKIAQAQQEGNTALASQLAEMRQASSSTDQRVAGIATDVTTVKTDVAQTRSDLDRTLADLKSVRGDLGLQSGLIATNAKELAALRSLGERDYVEFQLTKTKGPQRVGDVALQLKKADNKHSRYSIELIANDKRVEKKDRSVNEPVQFYMARARIPYELVVNEVRNDRIVGYLSAPKVRDAR